MINIKFCECGGLFEPNRNKLRCRNCGKEIDKQMECKLTTQGRKKEIVVIEDNAPNLPVMDKECPKCENDKAYYWLIQTRSSDEPPTQFFRCTKCKFVWREYK